MMMLDKLVSRWNVPELVKYEAVLLALSMVCVVLLKVVC